MYQVEISQDEPCFDRIVYDIVSMIKETNCNGGYHQEVHALGMVLQPEVEAWFSRYDISVEIDEFDFIFSFDLEIDAVMFELMWCKPA